MGTPQHIKALAQYKQSIFQQDMSSEFGDAQVCISADEACLFDSSLIQDTIFDLGIEATNLRQYRRVKGKEGQVYHDGGHPAVLLMPDPRTFEAADASYLGQHGQTFCVPLVGTEGQYIGALHEELEGLLGTTEICYGRLPGCPNLTFFFADQKTTEVCNSLVGPIPTIRGRVVVVHRDLDHLTIGIDPYSDAL